MLCPKCDGLKHIFSKGAWLECQCLTTDKASRSLLSSNFPRIYESATLRQFISKYPTQVEAKTAIQNWRVSWPLSTNLFFWDPDQMAGKMLSSIAALHAMKQGAKVLFTSPQELFEASMSGEVNLPVSQDLLILDLPNDFMNKKIPPMLCGIIYRRFNARKPIIYNSMFDKFIIGNYYTEPVLKILNSTQISQISLSANQRRQ